MKNIDLKHFQNMFSYRFATSLCSLSWIRRRNSNVYMKYKAPGETFYLYYHCNMDACKRKKAAVNVILNVLDLIVDKHEQQICKRGKDC